MQQPSTVQQPLINNSDAKEEINESGKKVPTSKDAVVKEKPDKQDDVTPEFMRVVYLSDLQCEEEEILAELYNIVHVAARFNRSHSVGGFFCADKVKKTVVQMFEGEYDTAMELWENIQNDRRHKIREGASIISNPDNVLEKWGMPLQEPRELLENLEAAGIDVTPLIKAVITPLRVASHKVLIEGCYDKIIRESDKSVKQKKVLTQARLKKKLAHQTKRLEEARERSKQALECMDAPEDHMKDLDHAYRILTQLSKQELTEGLKVAEEEETIE